VVLLPCYTPNGNPNNWWTSPVNPSLLVKEERPMFNLEVTTGRTMYLYLCPPAFVNGETVTRSRTVTPHSVGNGPMWSPYVCSAIRIGHVTIWRTELSFGHTMCKPLRLLRRECSWSVNNYSMNDHSSHIYVDDAKSARAALPTLRH